MYTFKAALLHTSVRLGLLLGIAHLGIWWVYRLCAGDLPGAMTVSWQTGVFNCMAIGIAFMYLGEHDPLGKTWRWLLGLATAGNVPVLVAYLFGC